MAGTRLRHVVIERFRRIRERLEIDFTSPDGSPVKQMVLAGPNGCGKTSVLEAILWGIGKEALITRDIPPAEREGHWRCRFPDDALVEVRLANDAGEWTVTIRGDGTADGQRNLGTGPSPAVGRTPVEYFSSWRAPALVGPVKPMGAGKRPAPTEANRLWRLKQRLVDERSRRSFEPQATHQDERWLARINEAWQLLHGDDDTRLDVQLVHPEAEDVYADVFVMRGDQRLCTIDQLSSGEIELVAAAGWIVTHEFDEGLLLIDEPELHLHPQWQATLLPALRRLAPGAQFIVATHSDAPWNQAFSFERMLLVPESDPRSATWQAKHPGDARESD